MRQKFSQVKEFKLLFQGFLWQNNYHINFFTEDNQRSHIIFKVCSKLLESSQVCNKGFQGQIPGEHEGTKVRLTFGFSFSFMMICHFLSIEQLSKAYRRLTVVKRQKLKCRYWEESGALVISTGFQLTFLNSYPTSGTYYQKQPPKIKV